LEIEVAFDTDTNFYWSLTENLSEAGLFIATHRVMPVGTVVELVMMVPDGCEPILAEGIVRWHRLYVDTSDLSPGMGVQFEPLAERDAARIRNFMAHREPLLFDID
jgi:uncharacterized protein (TIGR02266 family)